MESTSHSMNQRFDSLAVTNLQEFRQFFKRLHKVFPQQAAEACLLYLASHGLDPAAQSMAYWLVADTTYIEVLLDVNGPPPETASKAIGVVRVVDPQFLFKFTKAASSLKGTPEILHALALVPALVDYSILIPWLRTLGQNTDVRVRSRAAKLLCDLRPNKSLIEKQIQSSDARIRAGAVEALWHHKDESTCGYLRSALSDLNHRVVANAMVGLYLHGEEGALAKIIELSTHKQQLFRAASAWALGFVNAAAGTPTLRTLSQDVSLVVRKRALASLMAIESLKQPDQHPEHVEAQEEAVPAALQVEPEPPPAAEPPPVPQSPRLPDLNFSMFQ